MRFLNLWNEVPLEVLHGKVWELSYLFHEYLVRNVILWSVKSNWLYIIASLRNKNNVDAKSQQHLSSLMSWLIIFLSTVYLSFFCARMKQVSTIFVLLTISLSILYYFFPLILVFAIRLHPFYFAILYLARLKKKKKSFKPDRGRIRTRGGMLEIPGRIV